MPLLLKKSTTIKCVTKARPYYHRFNMVMSVEERTALHKLAKAYGAELGIKLPAAFIIRMALEETLPKMRADLRQAIKGRYHAKIRKEFLLS